MLSAKAGQVLSRVRDCLFRGTGGDNGKSAESGQENLIPAGHSFLGLI